MSLFIPDDILKETGLSARDLLIELACRLFDVDRLDFNTAARLAGLERVEFERELLARHLAVTHYSEEDARRDFETIAHLDAQRARKSA